MVSRDLLKNVFRLAVSAQRPVLVHSSLKSFGLVDGGAPTVVQALLDSYDTVFFPALTGKITDGPQQPPVMNVKESPTWTGAIPETARKQHGALRSLHPTHSLTGFGVLAEKILAGHDCTESPCDSSSPYARFAACGGVILLIGCDHNSNTMVHCCEELAGVGYHLQKEPTAGIVVTADRRITVVNKLHNWHKPPTDFNRIEELLILNRCIKTIVAGRAVIKIIDSAGMVEVLCSKLKKEPEFLFCR